MKRSTRKYTTENLTIANHPYDLIKQAFTILNIDAGQGPIGNKSGGPDALEKYWLKPLRRHFIILFRSAFLILITDVI